ncbi:hypothetical protein E1B28_006071 [Marasmius oreades]|uniref:Zn(2)-C6 fungal-type domain-containing protein n=1 Tax=Marasmius oreades TaxID=181124 RepID=A0A9P7S544_9AGAR|nr:uncharacterized protein E1B28_006071 [Marasmius oreades]KAG7095305.1 hypothetical protein E1B28_006071 [Marasmius oreades]
MMSYASSQCFAGEVIFNHYADYPTHPSGVSYLERPLSENAPLFDEESGRQSHYHTYSMDPHPHTSIYTAHGCFTQASTVFQQRDFQDYHEWPEYPLSTHYDPRSSEHRRPTSRYTSGLSSLPSSKVVDSRAPAQDHHSGNSAFQLTSSAPIYLPGSGQRPSLAGSLDPATGIFYRTPEHPRLRTAQACEKCRTRKAKCSGEHPACKRCLTRGLVCQYAKEGRVRGPNKPKTKLTSSPVTAESSPTSLEAPLVPIALQNKTVSKEQSLSLGHSGSPPTSFLITAHGTGLTSTTPPLSPESTLGMHMHSLPSPAMPIALDHCLKYHRFCHSLSTTDGQLSDNGLQAFELQSVSGNVPFQRGSHPSNDMVPSSEYSHMSQPFGLQETVPVDSRGGPIPQHPPHDTRYQGFQNLMCETTSSSLASPGFNHTSSPAARESDGPPRIFSRLGSNVGNSYGGEVVRLPHYEESSQNSIDPSRMQHQASTTEGLYRGFFSS